MNILKTYRSLPEYLPYEGYTFRLAVRGDFVGYFLTACHSKKKYKKAALREGYWLEKNRVPVDSVGSDYLFKVLLWTDEDTTLLQALNELYNILKKNGLPVATRQAEIEEETEFTEISELKLIPATIKTVQNYV